MSARTKRERAANDALEDLSLRISEIGALHFAIGYLLQSKTERGVIGAIEELAAIGVRLADAAASKASNAGVGKFEAQP